MVINMKNHKEIDTVFKMNESNLTVFDVLLSSLNTKIFGIVGMVE